MQTKNPGLFCSLCNEKARQLYRGTANYVLCIINVNIFGGLGLYGKQAQPVVLFSAAWIFQKRQAQPFPPAACAMMAVCIDYQEWVVAAESAEQVRRGGLLSQSASALQRTSSLPDLAQ